jgi:hypothetical protein
MLSELRKREYSQYSSNSRKIVGILRKRPQVRQEFSTIFPHIGARRDVVLLGFTPCGNYLVSHNAESMFLHDIILSAQEIKVSAILQRLQVLTLRGNRSTAILCREDDLYSNILDITMNKQCKFILVEVRSFSEQAFYNEGFTPFLPQVAHENQSDDETKQNVYYGGKLVYSDIQRYVRKNSFVFSLSRDVTLIVSKTSQEINFLQQDIISGTMIFITLGNIDKVVNQGNGLRADDGEPIKQLRGVWLEEEHTPVFTAAPYHVSKLDLECLIRTILQAYQILSTNASARESHLCKTRYQCHLLGPCDDDNNLLLFIILQSKKLPSNIPSSKKFQQNKLIPFDMTAAVICNPWKQQFIMVSDSNNMDQDRQTTQAASSLTGNSMM